MPNEQDAPCGTDQSGEAEPRSRRAHRSPASLDKLVEALLADSNGALSAYDIVRQARDRQVPLQPAQAYRVLARLVRRRRALRIELLSAYVLAPEEDRGVMVCSRCQAIQTFPIAMLVEEVERHCSDRGFSTRALSSSSPACARSASGADADCPNRRASRTAAGSRLHAPARHAHQEGPA